MEALQLRKFYDLSMLQFSYYTSCFAMTMNTLFFRHKPSLELQSKASEAAFEDIKGKVPQTNTDLDLVCNIIIVWVLLNRWLPPMFKYTVPVFVAMNLAALWQKGKLRKLQKGLPDLGSNLYQYCWNGLLLTLPFTVFRCGCVWLLHSLCSSVEDGLTAVAPKLVETLGKGMWIFGEWFPTGGEKLDLWIWYVFLTKTIFFAGAIMPYHKFYRDHAKAKNPNLDQTFNDFLADQAYALSYGVLNSWLNIYMTTKIFFWDPEFKPGVLIPFWTFLYGFAYLDVAEVMFYSVHKLMHIKQFYSISHWEHHIPNNPTFLIGTAGNGFIENIVRSGGTFSIFKCQSVPIMALHWWCLHTFDEMQHHYYENSMWGAMGKVYWYNPYVYLWEIKRKYFFHPHHETRVPKNHEKGMDRSNHGSHHWWNSTNYGFYSVDSWISKEWVDTLEDKSAKAGSVGKPTHQG